MTITEIEETITDKNYKLVLRKMKQEREGQRSEHDKKIVKIVKMAKELDVKRPDMKKKKVKTLIDEIAAEYGVVDRTIYKILFRRAIKK